MAAHLRRVDPAPEETTDRNRVSLLRLLDDVHHRMLMQVCFAVGGTAQLAEWTVLAALCDGVGHPMSEIAEVTHTLPPTLTKLVDRMVAGGLVYRRTDPLDRRRVLAFCTTRGRQRHRHLQTLIGEAMSELFDDDQLHELVGELHRRVVTGPEPTAASSEVV